MTIGTGTFLPQGQFYFVRSYVYELKIARYGDGLTRSAFRFTIHATPPDPTFAVVQFDNTWAVWNSNGRSLDHIVTEFWYKAGGVGPEIPLAYTLSYVQNPDTGHPCVQFEWFAGPPDFETFSLPAQPSNYWLPAPLP